MISAEVHDPHGLILCVRTAEEHGREMVIIEYTGSDPVYRLETRPLGGTLTIKEGKTRRKATVRLSGVIAFKPRDIPKRTLIVTDCEPATGRR